ncbi:hypothetical protein PTKIN_Ptkin06aG0102400 [Pterospermum kingtungense]
MFMKAYEFSLQPINGSHEWKKYGLEPLLPPIPRKTLGRPKRNHSKSKDEPKKSKGKMGRARVMMNCSLCGQNGHNKRGRPEKVTFLNVQGSSTVRPKAKARNKGNSSNASRSNPSSTSAFGTQANSKDTTTKKQNKCKEKLIVPERKSIRTRRPTIKGYGLLTNLKTG